MIVFERRHSMYTILKLILGLFFGSTDTTDIIIQVLFILGSWMLLKKSSLKPWWALIPCAREYQLARCANLTVSSPGFKALAAQADVNGKRNATVSRMLKKMGQIINRFMSVPRQILPGTGSIWCCLSLFSRLCPLLSWSSLTKINADKEEFWILRKMTDKSIFIWRYVIILL